MNERSETTTSEEAVKNNCTTFPITHLPGANKPLRRLIRTLQEELESLPGEPTEAAKKFEADLKDAEKENLSIATTVTKYEKFYGAIESPLRLRKEWQEKIHRWCADNLDEPTRTAIAALRKEKYDKPEKEICCRGIDLNDQIIPTSSCVAQATRKEEEAKQDYELTTAFEKTLSERFAELETLFKLATAKFEAKNFKAVCAIGEEFDEVYRELSAIRTWDYRRAECGSGNAQLRGPREEWPPAKLQAALTDRLRRLILARYQRFNAQQLLLTTQAESQKYSKKCEEFGKTRRDEFIEDAEDLVIEPQ